MDVQQYTFEEKYSLYDSKHNMGKKLSGKKLISRREFQTHVESEEKHFYMYIPPYC